MDTAIDASSHAHPHRPTTAPASPGRVIVVGGGLAGLAAAVRLAERRVAVTLLETRQRTGGRATGFTDPDTGEELDNCQHVLLKACTNLIDFYQRLDVADAIHWHETLRFATLDERGNPQVDTLTGDDLPAPFHLAASLMKMRMFSIQEKWAIVRGMVSIMQVSRDARRLIADESFAHWLENHRQPERVIRLFWSPVVVSGCNETIDRVAASYAVQVLQEGLLYSEEAFQVGLSDVPLAELYDPAEEVITRVGGQVRLGTSVASLESSNGRITGVRLRTSGATPDSTAHPGASSEQGELFQADAYILACPPDRLDRILSDDLRHADARLARLNDLQTSPIIGVHLFVRRRDGQPVMTDPHLVLPEAAALQWVFNKGLARGEPMSEPDDEDGGPTQHIHGVISAAHDHIDDTQQSLLERAMHDLRRFVPGGAEAELVRGRVIKERHATFSARPGVDQLRPPTRGTVPNLLLAGDWTATGWPATMEGAVRSGYRAAQAALATLGHPADYPLVIPDAQPGLIYRMLSA